MSQSIQAIRGFNDELPLQTELLRKLEQTLIDATKQYGYQEIRLPLVEKTELFSRSIGQATDIVHKEMYQFEDRNGQSIALRPEGTVGCVRLALQHQLLDNHATQRLWSLGPMFRYERPQKGRTRQFNQFSAEALGMPFGAIDCELQLLIKHLFKSLDLSLELQINWLGQRDDRQKYHQILQGYFERYQDDLSEEERIRLKHNPLRLLDSKNPSIQLICNDAPKLIDCMNSDQQALFEQYQEQLVSCKIPYHINERLVRGLDYYSGPVFEWVTSSLGSQGTVCAGGRYDSLIEDLGGKPNFAAGFSIGMERLALLYSTKHTYTPKNVDIYIISLGIPASTVCLQLSEILHQKLNNLTTWLSASEDASLKSQLKKADKSKADWVFIIGDDEVTSQTYTLKHLRHRDLVFQGNIDACIQHIREYQGS